MFPIASPLRLPCGATLPNRLAKAAMTEGLADAQHRATERHARLYGQWAQGGAGLLVTGNVQVDRRYLERPGNVAIEDEAGVEALRAWARAATDHGTQIWMQISHAGRQTPARVNPEPVGPSAIAVGGASAGYCGTPRALSEEEIDDVVRRFRRAACIAVEAGFLGVQIHAAHGYLVSSFLSPLANRRTDRWGGVLENRARLLIEILRAVRRSVPAAIAVAVKLNSADFQQGGFTLEECARVVEWLNREGVDLVELSGGNYEEPAMMRGVRDSTRQREAFFLEYAGAVRRLATMPLMVTGGFRSVDAMNHALGQGETDVIGLARPLCLRPSLPNALLGRSCPRAEEGPSDANVFWYYLQIYRMADGLPPDPDLERAHAFQRCLALEPGVQR